MTQDAAFKSAHAGHKQRKTQPADAAPKPKPKPIEVLRSVVAKTKREVDVLEQKSLAISTNPVALIAPPCRRIALRIHLDSTSEGHLGFRHARLAGR